MLSVLRFYFLNMIFFKSMELYITNLLNKPIFNNPYSCLRSSITKISQLRVSFHSLVIVKEEKKCVCIGKKLSMYTIKWSKPAPFLQ